MPQPSQNQTLENYRKSDAVFIVCQNNKKRTLEIAALNDEAGRATGFRNEDIVGKPLSLILPERISGTLNEFIEYEDNKSDLASVLGKVPNFTIRKQDGKEVEFRLRIVSGESVDRNPYFHLVLIDEKQARDRSLFRSIIKENFKGHEVIDPHTGLPDRGSLFKDTELMIYYVRDKNVTASFAVVDINDYDVLKDEYGKDTCLKLHKHINHIFKQKLRVEDTIGTLTERTLGIVLVDASQEQARSVLNRLRWAIGMSPLMVGTKELPVQVNICFAQVDGKLGNKEVIESCEEFAVAQRGISTNSIHLVVTYERRVAKKDRRQKNIPVKVERRKQDRRTHNDSTA